MVVKKKSAETEKEQLAKIRKLAMKKAERLEKESKGKETNTIEVICSERDVFSTKSNKKR